MSPPPTAVARPTQHALPPVNSRPPPSPAPRDSSIDPTLLPLFRAVDKDGEFWGLRSLGASEPWQDVIRYE